MTAYTSAQLSAMTNSLSQAQNATTSTARLAALANYYLVQTSVRGYASLALSVINNTDEGVVANQEVRDAYTASGRTFTEDTRASLALALANADIAVIQANHGVVPTLADVARTHAVTFQSAPFNLPLSAWGGSAFTFFGQDFTMGVATADERAVMQAPGFNSMTANDISNNLLNTLNAGTKSVGSLSVSSATRDLRALIDLDVKAKLFFGVAYLPIFFQLLQNADGTVQVADAQVGLYENLTAAEQLRYQVNTVPNGTLTNVTVTVGNQVTKFTIGATPTVSVDNTQTPTGNAIMITNGNKTLTGGSGNNLFLDFGPNAIINGGSGNNQALVNGANATVNFTNGAITFLAASSGTVKGTGNIIAGGVSDTITVNGNNNTATISNGSGTTLTMTGTNERATMTGGTFNLGAVSSATLTGNGVTSGIGANAVLTYNGNSGVIIGSTGNTIVATGNNNTVAPGTGSALKFNGQGEVAYATSTLITMLGISNSLALFGQGNGVTFSQTGGSLSLGDSSTTTLTGTGIQTTMGINSQMTINGVANTTALAAGAIATLNGTSFVINNDYAGSYVNMNAGSSATINGSGGYVGVLGSGVTANTSNEFIYSAAGVSFSVNGNGNVINEAGSNTLVLNGSSNTLTLGAGSAVTVAGTGNVIYNDYAGSYVSLAPNSSAAIYGSGGYVGVIGNNVNVQASNQWGYMGNGTSGSFVGNGNNISGGVNTNLSVQGTGNTVWLAGNDFLSLNGAGSVVSNTGGHNTTTLTGSATMYGTLDTFGVTGSANIYGDNNTITEGASSYVVAHGDGITPVSGGANSVFIDDFNEGGSWWQQWHPNAMTSDVVREWTGGDATGINNMEFINYNDGSSIGLYAAESGDVTMWGATNRMGSGSLYWLGTDYAGGGYAFSDGMTGRSQSGPGSLILTVGTGGSASLSFSVSGSGGVGGSFSELAGLAVIGFVLHLPI